MQQRLSISKYRNAGLKRVGARWLVCALCVVLPALAGVVRAAGTGTVNRVSGWYPAGTNVTVTATAGLYSHFEYWTGDIGEASMGGKEISFAVNGAMTIGAVFTEAVTDTNAVPHWWLAEQNPDWEDDFEAAVTNDADGDGFTTGEEYWSGTDPTNSSSFLHIAGIEVTATNVRLVWSHAKVAEGRLPPMSIQWRPSLTTGTWENAGEKLPADGVNSFDHLIQTKGFYRLSVTHMP